MLCQSIKQGVRCTVELEFSNALQTYLVDSFVTFKFCNRFGAFITQRSSMHSPLAIMCKYDTIDRWIVFSLESICIWIYNYPCVFLTICTPKQLLLYYLFYCVILQTHLGYFERGLLHQKQVSMDWIINYIQQFLWGVLTHPWFRYWLLEVKLMYTMNSSRHRPA